MRHLLDVNVWVALLDEAHVFHAQALAFVQRRKLKIATCALVENAVIRVLNMPAYSKLGPVGFEAVARKLADICTELDHEFWPDDVSLRTPGLVQWPRVLGHQQISDIYLLALAVKHGGRLVTFDGSIARTAVVGADARHLLAI